MIAQLNRMAAVASMAFVMVASSAPAHADVDGKAVLETYVDIALANYSDALMAARKLEGAIAALVAEPDEETLHNARAAWKAARIPYQQTEAFRFGNAIVDDWEGRVNAWPL